MTFFRKIVGNSKLSCATQQMNIKHCQCRYEANRVNRWLQLLIN